MKLIVTDTYEQVNGVSTTYKNLERLDSQILILHPGQYRNCPTPKYPEVQLCLEPWKVYQDIKKVKPPRIHIATEGIMGLVAKKYCDRYNIPHTTSYHTKFPEFLKHIYCVPTGWTYKYLKRFHRTSEAIFVPTEGLKQDLIDNGFTNNMIVWTRGIQPDVITDSVKPVQENLPRVLYAGRVSREKNLDELCQLEHEYNIRIVGDGPYLDTLKKKYPRVTFTGYKFGKELAQEYAQANVFAFPSLTDTFGIVIIEAMANGTPVAAHDVTGPRDIVMHGLNGALTMFDHTFKQAIDMALTRDREWTRNHARSTYTWENVLKIFNEHTGEQK